MKRKILTAALIALLLLMLCAFASAETVASGTCGADGGNLTWTLDGEGTLTISGSGEMADYTSAAPAPWDADKTSIAAVVIEDEVSSIGNRTFHSCSSLTGIVIGDSVTEIGDDAFVRCSSLADVSLPDSLTSIGAYAFSNCTGLTGISIPDSVATIGGGAFFNCTGLTGVDLPDSLTAIPGTLFNICTNLASVTIPDGVTGIGIGAFNRCSALTSVTIPDSVTTIGASAFSECTGLKTVTFPASDMPETDATAFNLCTPTIVCIKGSEVETWATANGYTVEYIGSSGDEETETPEEPSHTCPATVVSGDHYACEEDLVETIAATCTEGACSVYLCQEPGCGNTFKVTTSSALGHSPETDDSGIPKSVIISMPTCTKDGEIQYSCSECGTDYTERIKSTGHSWSNSVAVKPTCTEDGYTSQSCSVCGESQITGVTAALGHIYVEMTACSDLTCGSGSAECTTYMVCERTDDAGMPVCDYMSVVESMRLDDLPSYHQAAMNKLVTAAVTGTDADGNRIYETPAEVAARIMSGVDSGLYAFKPAAYVDAKGDDTGLMIELLPAAVTYTAASCTEPGSLTMTCTDEGGVCTANVSIVIPATGHTCPEDSYSYKAPTCTEKGFKMYMCEVCNMYCSETVPATGHTPDEEAGAYMAPTCTEDGYMVSYCLDCGETVSQILPATGHVWERPGYTGVILCPYNDEYYDSYYSATCQQGAYYFRTCGECGVKEKLVVSTALDCSLGCYDDMGGGFSGSNLIIDTGKLPTCTSTGSACFNCVFCGGLVETELPKLPHNQVVLLNKETNQYEVVCGSASFNSFYEIMQDYMYDEILGLLSISNDAARQEYARNYQEKVLEDLKPLLRSSDYIKGIGCGTVMGVIHKVSVAQNFYNAVAGGEVAVEIDFVCGCEADTAIEINVSDSDCLTLTDVSVDEDDPSRLIAVFTAVKAGSTSVKIGNGSFTVAVHSGQPLKLPADLTVIDAQAFEGADAEWVVIPESVESIGSRAFASCSNLTHVVFEGDPANIASDAFEGCWYPVIVCAEGSYAEAFAANSGYETAYR